MYGMYGMYGMSAWMHGWMDVCIVLYRIVLCVMLCMYFMLCIQCM